MQLELLNINQNKKDFLKEKIKNNHLNIKIYNKDKNHN